MRARAGLLLAFLAAPPALAQADGVRPFENRTFAAGLGSVAGANGVAVADYDRDGDLDVYVVVRAVYDAGETRTWSRLFANRGDGTFVDQTRQAGVAGSAGVGLPSTGGNGAKLGAAWGDYDGDGWPDLYLTHAGPNQLYRNLGDGTFADVTAAAGVAGGPTQLSTSALWFDADLDSDLDLHVGVWEDYPAGGAAPDLANRYFENLGDGTFREAPAGAGLGDPGKTYTSLPLDVDGDGDPDLYNANDFGPNRFYLNAGDGTFQEATASFGLEDGGEGMGLALGDLTGDGRGDVFLTNRADSPSQQNALFVSQAEGYAERAEPAGVAKTGWGWGADFFDLENDGDLDLYVVNGYFAADTPNALFRNDGAFPLSEVAASWGVADRDPARGLAVFDADADGRLDLLIANVSRAPHFYANRAATGAWLSVTLEGNGTNRDGLGATVEVEAGGRRQTRFHHGAQFLGQSLTPVHIGLGSAGAVDRVVVRWPGGMVDEVEGLAVDQRVRIRQGEGLVAGRPVSAAAPPRAGPSVRLLGAGPNPSAGPVHIHLRVDSPADVDLAIVDVVGRTVRRLRQPVGVGTAQIAWDGRGGAGGRVAAGLYLLTVSVDGRRVGTLPVAIAR